MPAIPFVGASYESISPNFSSQTTINLYPVLPKQHDQTKYQSALFSTPGKSTYIDLGGVSVRRLYATTSLLFAVVDSSLYKIDVNGTATVVGTLATNTGLCQITSNFTQIGIVDGTTNLYVYDIPTSTFSTNTIVNGASASTITMQDSFGIFTGDDSIYFYITGAGDFRTMDILDSGGISSASLQNELVTVASHSLELWLLGTTRTEIWRNVGGSNLPYQRAAGIFIEMGCGAKDSVQVIDNSIFWLGRDERGQALVCKADGYRPLIVSTEPLHRIFANYTTVADAKSYSYAEDGHLFYVLTFPTANATWVYDVTTELWHRRTSWHPELYQTTRDIANGYAFFVGEHLVGDVSSGKIYASSTNFYAEGTNPIYRERTLPTLSSPDLTYMTCRNIQVDVQSGTGVSTGQGYDPQITMRAQKDGVWGNEIARATGKVGEKNKRVRWNRGDIARNWTFRLSMTDPVQYSLLSVVADFEIGT